MTRRVPTPLIEVTALAMWLGAAAFFSVAVAPALFDTLPTRMLAGAVVGRLLPGVYYSGLVVGALVIAVEIMPHGAWSWRGREVLGAVIVLACGIAQFVIGPRIDRMRAEIAGPLESLPADNAQRAAFGRLHGASVAFLGLAMLAAVVALVLSARRLQTRP